MASLKDIPNVEELPLQPPPGSIVPNFAHPEDRAYQVYTAAAVCLPIILVFASLRLYAKVFLIRSRTRDDCKPFPSSHSAPQMATNPRIQMRIFSAWSVRDLAR